MMHNDVFQVLFLCTGNSARSIMAECLLNHLGAPRWQAYSAGSHPKGVIHPLALETMQHMGLSVYELRSKSWEEFLQPDAPLLDLLITVCDDAAGEVCPLWPGKPLTTHWSLEDPTAWTPSKDIQRQKFQQVARILQWRIELLLHLPLDTLGAFALQDRLHEIAQEDPCHLHVD